MRPLIALLMAMLPLATAGEAPAPGPAKTAAPAESADFDPLKARLPAGEAETLTERTARADLVCVAEATKVRDDGTADCRVGGALKGSVKGNVIRVRFTKTFGGAWPQKGVAAIYFLKAAPAAKAGFFSKTLPTYQLISDTAGLAAPTEDRLAVVRLAAEGKRVSAEEKPALEMPAPDSLEGMALDAVYVALGTVQEVSLPDPKSKSADCSAVLAFRLERAFKGDFEPGAVHIYVPAARPEFTGPEQKPLVPRVGPAGLFFRRDKQGGSYRLLSPYRGHVASGDARELGEKLAAAIAAEKRLRAMGLVGNTGGHDSVRDTIKTWMEAWNTKTDIEGLVACYSRRSPWRQKWESGPEARQELTKTMATYPGTINVVCDRVDEKDKDAAVASVRLQVMVTDPSTKADSSEVRSVEMTFTHENGQWLILEEGN